MNVSHAGGAAHQASSQADAGNGQTVAVAKKALDNVKLEGKMALGLIEAAGAPPPPTATRGSIVNTYA